MQKRRFQKNKSKRKFKTTSTGATKYSFGGYL